MESVQRQVLFDQDRLAAYNLGRAFAREMEALMTHLPRGHVDQCDQLRRATLSITLNTAEGAGEFKPKEKARFYRIARRSATECAAALDSFVDRGMLTERDIEPPRRMLHRTVGALTRLILALEGDARPSRSPSPSPAPAPASSSVP